jgi:hypothetical protein
LTPDELIIRGESAKRLLNDPLFVESLEKLESDIFEAWARTGIRDKEGQHELLLMVQTARKFKALLATVLMTGEVEAKQLQKPTLNKVLERFGVY